MVSQHALVFLFCVQDNDVNVGREFHCSLNFLSEVETIAFTADYILTAAIMFG